MRSFKIKAVIIRKRNFLEKDRILTLFTKENGKIEALAKGARRPGSKLSYHCDIGFIGKFHIASGKNIHIITEIEPVFTPEGARGEFLKTEKLGFMFRVIDRLYHEDEPHRLTFDLLEEAVKKISKDNYQLIFLVFVLRVIEDLGLKPELYHCISCRKLIEDPRELAFSEKGGICHIDCRTGEPIRKEVMKLLRLIFDKPFDEIACSKVNPKIFIETYKLAQSYFEWNFGKILPEKVL